MNSGMLKLLTATLAAACALAQPADTVPPDPLHIWTNQTSPESISQWVTQRLEHEKAAVQRIESQSAAPTIENTLVPYDDAQNDLFTAGSEAGLMNAVHADKAVRDRAQNLVQKVSAAVTDLSLNRKVYKALAAIDASSTDPATRHYLERTLLEYRLAGVDKDDTTRAKVRKLQDRVTELSLTFSRNIAESVLKVPVKDKADLVGLPEDFLAKHPAGPDGVVTLTTDNPDLNPVLDYTKSDDLRRRMYLAYMTRAYPANKQVLLDLLATRNELASLLGYNSWADFATADQMTTSAANVKQFLSEADAASRAGAEREYKTVLAFAQKQQPGLVDIPNYGKSYWSEQYRRSSFDFDSQSVRPFFPYERVQTGVLDTAAKLFHVTFKQVKAQVWDPSVSAFDVYDRDKNVGRFYLDMHPRPGKDKWFSTYPLLPGIRGKQQPEGALICNFAGGIPGEPGLMQYQDVVTFLHEFGHLMHHILGGQQSWSGISGITTEGDFSEAPSQMLEEFFHDPAILQSFARHYQTDAPIPVELVNRMNLASAFGRGAWVQSQIFYSSYSLDVHNRKPQGLDLDELLKADSTRYSFYKWTEGNRMYASFTHLTGYSSNYYTYLLDKVIALDFFSQFDRSKLLDGPTAMRYRKSVLEPGGSKPAADLVKDFLGRPQKMDALKTWMNEEFTSRGNGAGTAN